MRACENLVNIQLAVLAIATVELPFTMAIAKTAHTIRPKRLIRFAHAGKKLAPTFY